jgi:DNA helicase II / ATP-dependent DNA helicase PcrA
MRKGDSVQQDCIRNENGENVKVVICQSFDEISRYIAPYSEYCILTLKNEFVTKLKINSEDNYVDFWDAFQKTDYNRQVFYHHLAVALAYAYQKKYENSLKELLHIFKPNNKGELREPLKGRIPSSLLGRSIAISILEHLVDLKLSDLSLYAVNEDLISFLLKNTNEYKISLQRITKGEINSFSRSILFSNLVGGVKLGEDLAYIRTIHKAKGAEFKTVFVYLHDEVHLNCILKPNLEGKKDLNRIFYVAFSRAMDNLFILMPSLSPEKQKSLEALNLGIQIETPLIYP